MNKQLKTKSGHVVGRGIEWTDRTWNPIGGCYHGCRWTMPDGTTAVCYAETVAERLAQKAYPHGFAHHYFRPDALDKPSRIKEPQLIFVDSMSDLAGHWVPAEQRTAVLNVMRETPQHTYQLLTKAAPQLLTFAQDIPKNCWILVSSPPDEFMGKALRPDQQKRMLARSLDVLATLKADYGLTVGMSFEPLSWDVSDIVLTKPALDWAIIGAASNGSKYFQPEQAHVKRLLKALDGQRVPVFFKGNLVWEQRREDFPITEHSLAAVSQRQEMADKYGWPSNLFYESNTFVLDALVQMKQKAFF
jgi:protein gp37